MRLVIEGLEDGVRESMGNLQQNLAWLRKQHRLTNDELGLLAGVKERQVSVWLNSPISMDRNGQESFNPRMMNLARLSAALGIFTGDLFIDNKTFARKYRNLHPLVRLQARDASPSSSASTGANDVAVGGVTEESPLCQPALVPQMTSVRRAA